MLPPAGGLGQAAPHIHANELAWRLAAAHQGRAQLLRAPAIVAHRGIRTALLSDPATRRVLERARLARVALVGIGALVPSFTLIQSGHLSAAEVAALRAIPLVIGVAGGLEKPDAILGALSAQLITVLVTGDVSARAVLARQRLQAPEPVRRASGRR